MACEIAIDPGDFVKPGATNPHHSSIITTEALLGHVRAATTHRLEKRGAPFNLKDGDLVHVKRPKERHRPRDLRVGPFPIVEYLGRLKYEIGNFEQWREPAGHHERHRGHGNTLDTFVARNWHEMIPLR